MKINELKVGKIYESEWVKYKINEKGILFSSIDGRQWDSSLLSYNDILQSDFTEVPQKRWRAEKNKYYWFMDNSGSVIQSREDFKAQNLWHYSTGNYFKTEQEAENYREKLLIIQAVQDWANEHNDVIDVSNFEQEKWYWSYNYDTKKTYIYYRNYSKINGPAFSSEELAEECWSIFDDKWKKYVLKIKV